MTIIPGAHAVADEYADLEMSLHRRDAVTWTVELRFSLPRTDAETQLDVSGPLLARIVPRGRQRRRAAVGVPMWAMGS